MTQANPQDAIAADLAGMLHALAGLGSWVCDFDSGRLSLSPEAARLLGTTTGNPGMTREDLHACIPMADRPRVEACWRNAQAGKVLDLEYRLDLGTAEPVWVWEKARFDYDPAGRPLRAIGILQDITQRRRHQEEMRFQANYDSLTHLPNRNLLAEHLGMAIPMARRRGHRLAVLFVDLDRFKQVNDVLGHEMGDELLRHVAMRMKDCLREADIVARQGGDEFIVVLHDIQDDSDAGLVGLKLVEQLSRPFDLHGVQAHIGASVGLTVFPEDGIDADTLFRNADMAMYQAKAAGRETICFFDPVMRRDAMQRHNLETELRQALVRNEFTLHYQPIYSLASRHPHTLEALIRWQHPSQGLIGPDHFIPAAEENGLIREIGRWVINEVCQQQARWRSQGLDLTVSLNVSTRQISDGLPIEWLRETLAAHGADPARLVFEITEGVMIRDTPVTRRWINGIADLGIQLALDDFGTGYASLGFLRNFRMHQVKIDKSFVMGMLADPVQRALVKSIVDIGRNMGLRVTAEGIEDAQTLTALESLGCSHAQGYHLSRPLTPENLFDLLAGPDARPISYPYLPRSVPSHHSPFLDTGSP